MSSYAFCALGALQRQRLRVHVLNRLVADHRVAGLAGVVRLDRRGVVHQLVAVRVRPSMPRFGSISEPVLAPQMLGVRRRLHAARLGVDQPDLDHPLRDRLGRVLQAARRTPAARSSSAARRPAHRPPSPRRSAPSPGSDRTGTAAGSCCSPVALGPTSCRATSPPPMTSLMIASLSISSAIASRTRLSSIAGFVVSIRTKIVSRLGAAGSSASPCTAPW